MNIANRPQQPAKPTFSDLCLRLLPDPSGLQVIADRGGISKNIIDALFASSPVERSDAIRVLAVFSEMVGETWTLDMVDILLTGEVQPEHDGPILPYFGDLYIRHQFPVPLLALEAGVSMEILNRMLVKEPVPIGDAKKVLQALSVRTGEQYNLQTVVVPLIEE